MLPHLSSDCLGIDLVVFLVRADEGQVKQKVPKKGTRLNISGPAPGQIPICERIQRSGLSRSGKVALIGSDEGQACYNFVPGTVASLELKRRTAFLVGYVERQASGFDALPGTYNNGLR
jgi:hypothetical protein